jgi:hypothetical protein
MFFYVVYVFVAVCGRFGEFAVVPNDLFGFIVIFPPNPPAVLGLYPIYEFLY